MSTRSTLKHWFVPHLHNNHHPHAIRSHGLSIFVVAILLTQVVWNISVGHGASVLGYATDLSPSNLLAQTNQQRHQAGLTPLELNGDLAEAADAKAHDMLANNYWAHVSPSGTQPWSWISQTGYSYAYAGENLAKGFQTTAGVIDGWMNSPEHRANMLGSHYRDVGFAVVTGSLQHHLTTLVVAYYGSVNSDAAPTAPETQTTTLTPITFVSASQTSYSLFHPLAVWSTLGWGTALTLSLLAVLLLLFAATHLVVWKKGLVRWQKRHYRLWAAAELATIIIVMLVIISSSFGTVR